MTSIEWLIEEMFKQGYFDGNKPLTFTNLDHLQQQAKEMHKQEIKTAWNSAGGGDAYHSGEQYYQETFVSKGSDECPFFISLTKTTSATICSVCGKEKYLHKP